MYRAEDDVSPRAKPSRPPSKVVPALLAILTAGVGFATLMVRLEVTREGYRISALREEISRYQDENRHLRLTSAQLSSHERLRAMAPQFHLAPPARGQVVMLP
jgi:cell division protein FtsL